MASSGMIRKTQKDPGPVLGRDGFEEIKPLGPGLYRGWTDGKCWMLKTAREKDAASLELLRREYEIGRSLQHPGLVSSLFFLEDSPVGPAILMEYFDGRPLDAYLSENPSAGDRERVLFELLDAVEYLHKKGILHNDIKPGNILVTRVSNDVKVLDFGLSETDGSPSTRRLGGTPGFTAPEVLGGDLSSVSTAAADIYSLGQIIRLLCPGRYTRVVRRCLATEPSKRYRNVAALREALQEKAVRPGHVAAVAGGLLALAGLLWGVYHWRPQPSAPLPAEVDSTVAVSPVIPETKDSSPKQEKRFTPSSALQDADAQFKAWYQEAEAQIDALPPEAWSEFVHAIYAGYASRTQEYTSRHLSDLSLANEIARLSIPYGERLLEEMEGRPSLEKARLNHDISNTEYDYYRHRLDAGAPYAPWPGN